MAYTAPRFGSLFLAACLLLVVLPAPVAAFGAGNIPSIAQVEGKNFRHGDIEDMLKTLAFIKGHKWTTMMIKRVYFGNWLRDYSQAVDVGSLKGVNAPTIRILVWVLGFLSFGYATAEFEVTEERLGVYRPEEHIDNPKGYADDLDARAFDPRLRGPIQRIELDIDPNTGMKNYIANDNGGWATSSGYIRFSFARSIHFGRLYTNGTGNAKGREADLCEALRCLGQGLHCMEDFGAHTNYCELALRELGFHEVFPHTGAATEMNIRGRRVFPLVTGTFGGVDFLHSVLGEATDHFAQSEVDEMDLALKGAENAQGAGQRGPGDGSDFSGLIAQVPGMGGLAQTARDLQSQSAAQEYENATTTNKVNTNFTGPPGSTGAVAGPGIPGMSPNFDPIKTARQIYPILEFRDKVVRAINHTIANIPGLESLIEKIGEKLTVFVLSLLSPFIRPIIESVSAALRKGSSGVLESSAKLQFEPWTDPNCTDPTHSMLSKDHFSNMLNPIGGRIATKILQYVTPRILYAWENPGVPVDEVMNDIVRVFHHPGLRDESIEIHRIMFNTVKEWADERHDRSSINRLLSSASVKDGRNHIGGGEKGGDHNHGALGGHGKTSGSIWSEIKTRDLASLGGSDTVAPMPNLNYSPQPPGSPSQRPASPQYGYQNPSQPITPAAHLNPNPYQNTYQAPSPQQSYQVPYDAPQDPYGFQQPPYGSPQPPYGAEGQYQGGWAQGPPPGLPQQGYPVSPPQPGYPGQQQPPQPPYGDQPPYGGYQGPPAPGGGYGY